MITHSIEIDRQPEDVFAYLDQLERHGEWQSEVLSAEIVTSGTVGVGTRVREVRRFAGREQSASYEITEHDPPRLTAFRGLDGPVRPVGTVRVEPLGDGARSRVSVDFDLVGHGFGKLIAPLARMHARRTIPVMQAQLKERLESGV